MSKVPNNCLSLARILLLGSLLLGTSPAVAQSLKLAHAAKCTGWPAGLAREGFGFRVGRAAEEGEPDGSADFVAASEGVSDWEGAIRKILIDSANYFMGLVTPPEVNCQEFEYAIGGDYELIWEAVAVLVPPAEIDGDLGEFRNNCDAGGFNEDVRLILLNQDDMEETYPKFSKQLAGGPPVQLEVQNFLTPPHELFHAIYEASYLGKLCAASGWVSEGITEAFAVRWFEQSPWNNQDDGNWYYRNYNRSLHGPAPKSTAGKPSLEDYGNWLFWYFVGGQYDKNPFSRVIDPGDPDTFSADLVKDFMNPPGKANIGAGTSPGTLCRDPLMDKGKTNWDLDWLDKVLKCWMNRIQVDPPEHPVEGGLYVMYPRFATWLVDKFRVEPEFDELFPDGCLSANLVSGQSEEIDISSLPPVSIACIIVTFDPSVSSGAVTVTARGTGPMTQLQMGRSYRAIESLPSTDGSNWRSWEIYGAADEEAALKDPSPTLYSYAPIYLALTNVAAIAKDTAELKGITLTFDYKASGELNLR